MWCNPMRQAAFGKKTHDLFNAKNRKVRLENSGPHFLEFFRHVLSLDITSKVRRGHRQYIYIYIYIVL